VVSAIFLCLTIWVVSSLRAALPQLNIPFLISTIFSLVGLTFGSEILAQSDSFAITKQLILSYLTGFGISTFVGLFVFPITSRSVFLEGSFAYLELCHSLLKEERDMLRLMYSSVEIEANVSRLSAKISTVQSLSLNAISTVSHLTEELSFARNEIAIGQHSIVDLQSILLHLQALLIPLLGLSKIVQLDLLAVQLDATDLQTPKLRMLSLCCFDRTLGILENALRHTSDILGSTDLPFRAKWKEGDNESGDSSRNRSNARHIDPVYSGLATGLQEREQKFETYRLTSLRELRIGNDTSSTTQLDGTATSTQLGNLVGDKNFTSSAQLQQHLYIQHLLLAVTVAAHNLEKFAESKIQSITSSKWQLNLPLVLSPFVIFKSVLRSRGETQEPNFDYQGHPEHLPPTNSIQKLGDTLRAVLRTLTSDSSKFGFRVTAATFSIGVLAFLEQTQRFFVEFRLVWAMVM
jgi:hypothetical protein